MNKSPITKTTNNKKEFQLLPKEEVQKIIKRMTQPGYRRINIFLKPNASTEEKIKYNLCKSIVGHASKNNLTEKELVKKLGVDQEKIEYILFCHINKLSLEELITDVDKLNIPLEVKINNQHGHQKTPERTRQPHYR